MEAGPQLLFKEKQARILALLSKEGREWHLAELAQESGSTYVHTSRFISACEKAGIVTAELHGRRKNVILTDKGRKIAQNVAEIVGIVTGQIKVAPQAGAPAQAPPVQAPAAVQAPTQAAP